MKTLAAIVLASLLAASVASAAKPGATLALAATPAPPTVTLTLDLPVTHAPALGAYTVTVTVYNSFSIEVGSNAAETGTWTPDNSGGFVTTVTVTGIPSGSAFAAATKTGTTKPIVAAASFLT